MLGPKTAADEAPEAKVKAPAKDKAAAKTEGASAKDKAADKKTKEARPAEQTNGSHEAELTFKGASANFHPVGCNDITEGYVSTPNTKRLLAEHYKAVNGRVSA